MCPGRQQSGLVSTRRGGRRRGGGLAELPCLVERLADLGRHQHRGHRDRWLDGQRLGELLLAQLPILEPFDDHHAHVNVGARRDRVTLQPRRPTERERPLEDLARLLELPLVDGGQGLAVQLRHPRGRLLRFGDSPRRRRSHPVA